MKINPLAVTFTPLAGSTFTNLIRMIAQNRFSIGLIGFPRVMYSLLMSSILSPLNVVEKIQFKTKIAKMRIDKDPIFILGHWRSGTTYLHNLLSQDQNFGFPTTFQTVTPGLFLRFGKSIKPIVAASLPPTRPEDNVPLGVDFPQEEEYAIGNLSPFSFYNGWCFPKNMEFYYRFVTMENVLQQQIDEWKEVYLYFLKKVTLAHHGKQLLLKNPANTARIRLLLEMFPKAKFIHIHRNPYHTFLSMKRNIETEMTLYCVQKPKNDKILEELMVRLYNDMFDKFFREKNLILQENFVEIKYEDLIERPVEIVRHIYKTLNLSSFNQTESQLRKFIETQVDIKPHQYVIEPELKNKIYKYFKHTIDYWGYTIS